MGKITINKYCINTRSSSTKISTVMIATLILLGTAFNAGGTISVSSVELRGEVATGTHAWNSSSFTGFFYDVGDNSGNENMVVTTSGADNRTIAESALNYLTWGFSKPLKISARFPGYAAYMGLENFGAGKMAVESENYTIVGWLAEKYVAIKMQPNKLTKLLLEQGSAAEDKKTLTVGETWVLGGGYTLIVNSIDAKATPRQVWLTLNKDGAKKDDKVVTSGGSDSKPIYTYTEKSLCGENDVPVFVTYVDSVFAGATTDMVQFRYTWLINSSCTQINSGDVFGSLRVTNTDPLELRNTHTAITLSRDSVVDVAGDIKLKVADNNSLRYYPFIQKTAPGTYEARGNVATGSHFWDARSFPGFYYDINDNSGNEKLGIRTSGSDNRTIAESGLTYETWGNSSYLKVVQHQFNSDGAAAIAAGLQQFGAGNMGALAGQYYIVGWQGEKFVGIKRQPNKLTRLLIEHGAAPSDRKNLTVGETWNIGNWSLKVNSTNMGTTPKKAQLILKYDGIKKNESVVNESRIYTYVENNLANETSVPLFVTYVDSIFSNGTANIVQLRYTWALSPSVTEIRAGNRYGVFTVTNTDPLELKNSDSSLTLSTGTVMDLMGELKLRVADDWANLRYYPFIGFQIPEPPGPIQVPFNMLTFNPKSWNLVSVPKVLKNASVDAAFKNLSGDPKNIVWQYNSSSRKWEHPSRIIPLMSYWVYNNASTRKLQKLDYLSSVGPNFVPSERLLKSGWNLIGHSSTDIMPVPSALVSISGKYRILFTYDREKGWKSYNAIDSGQQQFNIFEPGRGYWIFMTEDATYTVVNI